MYAPYKYAVRLLSPAVALFGFSHGAVSQEGTISPERATVVYVSNRDINRVHCPSHIDDVVWSEEKPVKVVHDEQRVFVKFLLARQGEMESHAQTSLDLHVVCGGEVYTLILHPRDIDTVSIKLGDEKRRAVQTIAKEWGALPMEERIKRFTLALYRSRLPDGFARKGIQTGDARRNVNLFENAQIIGQYEVSAPGSGLKAVEYVVYSSEAVQLNEGDFLTPKLGDVVGVTLEPLHLDADSFARLIVIERAAGETGGTS